MKRIEISLKDIKIKFTDTHVKLMLIAGKGKASGKRNQKFCRVKLAECGRIPTDCKYMNPRIKFDGLNWWISVSVNFDTSASLPLNDGIGIDLGVKDLAICSDGNTYKNIHRTQKVKKLEKQKRRLQRSLSRKYENNKKGGRRINIYLKQFNNNVSENLGDRLNTNLHGIIYLLLLQIDSIQVLNYAVVVALLKRI